MKEKYILNLSKSIFSILLELWVPSSIINSITKTMGLTTADVIADQIKAKKINRELDELVDSFLIKHYEVFETESINLTEDERNIVISLLNDSLNLYVLSNDYIVAINIDENKIIRQLLSKIDTKLYEEKIVSIFERVLRDLISKLILIKSELPDFQLYVDRKILNNQDNIMSNVELILKRINDMKLSLENDDIDNFIIENYKKLLFDKLSKIEIFGISTKNINKKYDIEKSYTRLSYDSYSHNINNIDIYEALKRSNRLLFLGGAGSGKTTLLKWLSRGIIKNNLQGLHNDKIPLFIKLRDYSHKELPPLTDIPYEYFNNLDNLGPREWIRTQIKNSNVMLLIDGIDELDIKNRNKFYDWLDSILKLHNDMSIIMSSRYYALDEIENRSIDFHKLTILPLSSIQVEKLITQWFISMIDDKDERDLYISKLLQKIRQSNQLKKLATNPLLCSMICALYLDSNENIPDDRIQLYKECIDMLLEKRDVERGILHEEKFPNLSLRLKTKIISSIAYWYSKNGESEVNKVLLLDKIGHIIQNYSNDISSTAPSVILDYFTNRTSILRYTTESTIDFPHKTFQEYLSAIEVNSEHDFKLMLTKKNEDYWREIIILACGLATEKNAGIIINDIYEASIKEKNNYYLFLSVSCLNECLKIDKSLREKINDSIKQLIPVKSITEASNIATAKDMVVPYLTNYKYENLNDIKLCIRALGYIGTDNAMEGIVSFKEYFNDSIAKTLLLVWKHFDIESFASKVLSSLKKIKIDLTYIDIINLKYLDGIEDLSFTHNGKTKNLQFLSNFKKLKKLDLGDIHSLGNVTFFEDLFLLNSLIIRNYKGSFSMRLLRNSKEIQSLSLIGFNIIDNLDSCEFQYLEKLNIRKLKTKLSINKLHANNLKIIYIDNGKFDYNTIEAFVALPTLEHLYVDDKNYLMYKKYFDKKHFEVHISKSKS